MRWQNLNEGTPASDNYVQSYMIASAIRPLLGSSIDKGARILFGASDLSGNNVAIGSGPLPRKCPPKPLILGEVPDRAFSSASDVRQDIWAC